MQQWFYFWRILREKKLLRKLLNISCRFSLECVLVQCLVCKLFSIGHEGPPEGYRCLFLFMLVHLGAAIQFHCALQNDKKKKKNKPNLIKSCFGVPLVNTVIFSTSKYSPNKKKKRQPLKVGFYKLGVIWIKTEVVESEDYEHRWIEKIDLKKLRQSSSFWGKSCPPCSLQMEYWGNDDDSTLWKKWNKTFGELWSDFSSCMNKFRIGQPAICNEKFGCLFLSSMLICWCGKLIPVANTYSGTFVFQYQ